MLSINMIFQLTREKCTVQRMVRRYRTTLRYLNISSRTKLGGLYDQKRTVRDGKTRVMKKEYKLK